MEDFAVDFEDGTDFLYDEVFKAGEGEKIIYRSKLSALRILPQGLKIVIFYKISFQCLYSLMGDTK